ncbi:MAG: succinate dehydrogenase cytochrome b subunit [Bdellovibrionales bacterium]|nr:succinate dehydrogenase cytochrome b subunit [Bdellovibrionales bacterium]
MNNLLAFFSSSIGRKVLIAITGLLLVLFLIAHLIGNLLFFLGPDSLNSYAAALKGNPALLWSARIGLLTVFVLHLMNALALAMQNRAARGVQYQNKGYMAATAASRTMVITGLVVLLYVAYHLSHFTLGLTNPDHFSMHDAQGRHDVYGMILHGFQIPVVAWGYVAAMLVVAYHLSHGIQSSLQTFGLRNENYTPCVKQFSVFLALLLCLGFSSIPLAVQFGLVG